MKDRRRSSFLYLTVTGYATPPVIDAYTRRMTAMFRAAVSTTQWRGSHKCRCGALSSRDHLLPGGRGTTNDLAVHYVACHRVDVAEEDLDLIAGYGAEAEPTEDELHYYVTTLTCATCETSGQVARTVRGRDSWSCDVCHEDFMKAVDRGLDAITEWVRDHPTIRRPVAPAPEKAPCCEGYADPNSGFWGHAAGCPKIALLKRQNGQSLHDVDNQDRPQKEPR